MAEASSDRPINTVHSDSDNSSTETARKDDKSAHKSNLNTTEIDADTHQKLRGDAIGDTVYSESFVAKTLLSLQDLKWDEKLEEDLCFLWDMTLEKTVCEYLLRVSFPSIACSVITSSDVARLIEILVGILANLSSLGYTKDFSNDEIQTVLLIIDSEDSLILIQVMRFLHCVAYSLAALPFITSSLLEKLNFILCSSVRKDLLANSLEALSRISEEGKIDVTLLKGELIASGVIACKEIITDENGVVSVESEVETSALVRLMRTLCNYCVAWEASDYKNNLGGEIFNNLPPFCGLTETLCEYYVCEDNLMTILNSDLFETLFSSAMCVFELFSVKYSKTIFRSVVQIVSLVIQHKSEQVSIILNFMCYLISVGDPQEIRRDLGVLSEDECVLVLREIKNSSLVCAFNYKSNFNIVCERWMGRI